VITVVEEAKWKMEEAKGGIKLHQGRGEKAMRMVEIKPLEKEMCQINKIVRE
jgi:hypothetical protein